MSDHIPFEIQEEILIRLPVKSLIQFRSVSKSWKSLIDSPDFIATHSTRSASHHLLVRYDTYPRGDKHCISFADAETFPQEKFEPTVPLSIERLRTETTIVVGSSDGLLCFFGAQGDPCCLTDEIMMMAVIWNPSIRKSVTVAMRCRLAGTYTTVLGFGVCPGTTDIKLVKITYRTFSRRSLRLSIGIPWQVEIYTSSSGCWRSSHGNIPCTPIAVKWSQVVIDRFIYWFAIDNYFGYCVNHPISRIMSFDMNTDEFKEVSLPDSLALQCFPNMSLSKLRDSLAVLEYSRCWHKPVRQCHIWEMKPGVQTSFTKLFTIEAPFACIQKVLGFSKSGRHVLLSKKRNTDQNVPPISALVVYEPCSESINNFGIYGLQHSFFVNSYMETLLLLNVPES